MTATLPRPLPRPPGPPAPGSPLAQPLLDPPRAPPRATPPHGTPAPSAAPRPAPRRRAGAATPGIAPAARARAYLAGALVTAGLVGVACRAWDLQVGQGDRYRALAARQHALSVDIPAPRGDVIDARGRPLAVSADADSIWADPRAIRDVTETSAQLARLTRGDAAALEAKLAGDRRFVWISRHVTPETARAVREARLPGIEVAREPRRWYPGRTLAGPVLGRAGIDGTGLDGIELTLDRALQGRGGAASGVRDARGRRMYADGLDRPEPGATVRLTLDRSVQAIAERALGAAIDAHRARSGAVVVLEVGTGRVLALASAPSFDPNTGAAHATGARNRPVTDVFEAGSAMKLFTVAAALDAGVVRADTAFDLQWGTLQIGSKTIRDVYHDPILTTAGIIKRSSNVGAVKIAQRLGRERLHAALRQFGFGAATGIELPGEQAGTLRPGARWREIELATVAFGYGLTVTPLQMAAAIAAIGDDGVYRAPRVVESVTDAAGTRAAAAAPAPRRIVSADTARAVRAMMATVFEGGKQPGTASSIVVPGFRCGGKSGTAHKWDAAAKQYAPDRYLSSFAGLAPIAQPRLAIVVFVDEPSGGDYYGGKVAGPVFATVASEALRYLGVPGEAPVCAPGAAPASPIAARTCVPAAPGPREAGAAAAPAPAAIPAIAVAGDGADPETPGSVTIPELRGLSAGRALAAARAARLGVELSGTGRVVEQDPPPGRASSARVVLRLGDDGPHAAGRARQLASPNEIGEAARSAAMPPLIGARP
jgi:cell division protein FtsI (penicillin-binding protein 3)